mmetsp:Transcript_18336/g.31766  ORF Transcript_18336/g.31766 Transcript_18336/m.31766 type:complete len:205 (-) Transcript_18336:2111-2725(-)
MLLSTWRETVRDPVPESWLALTLIYLRDDAREASSWARGIASITSKLYISPVATRDMVSRLCSMACASSTCFFLLWVWISIMSRAPNSNIPDRKAMHDAANPSAQAACEIAVDEELIVDPDWNSSAASKPHMVANKIRSTKFSIARSRSTMQRRASIRTAQINRSAPQRIVEILAGTVARMTATTHNVIRSTQAKRMYSGLIDE